MTKRVVTCSSWREARADEADEFFSNLFGGLVLIGLGIGAVHLLSGASSSAPPPSAQSAPQEQIAQPAQPTAAPAEPVPESGQPSGSSEAAGANQEPSANAGSAPNPASQTCWFTPLADGNLQGESCSVVKRVNANGDTVYDVTDNQGAKRTVVLWHDASAEVIRDGTVQKGTWKAGDQEDIWVSIDGKWFCFDAV